MLNRQVLGTRGVEKYSISVLSLLKRDNKIIYIHEILLMSNESLRLYF